jgi:hypothetical protein
MKVNLLKINNNNWVVIPLRNTVQEILDIYSKNNIDEFTDLLNENIIKDINGEPDILKATEIIKKYNIKEIEFELYESF